jgi:sigma-B regulation protein RsbU (phosphoserine phosphatase)
MEEFGMNRLTELLRDNRQLISEEILEGVYKSVLDFSGSFIQYDDFTMVIAKFFGTIREAKNYIVTLPASIESIPLLRDYILQIAQNHGLSGHYLEDILLATDEAATNIITHAYKQEKSKRLAFRTKIHIDSEKIFRITFTDEGMPFRIEEVRAPSLSENLLGRRTGGFGVYLIRSLMDNVKYYREGNKNYLMLEKKLSNS